MTDQEERAYLEGQAAVWRRMLREALTNLKEGGLLTSGEAQEARLTITLTETRAAIFVLADTLGVEIPAEDHDMYLPDLVGCVSKWSGLP